VCTRTFTHTHTHTHTHSSEQIRWLGKINKLKQKNWTAVNAACHRFGSPGLDRRRETSLSPC